jgi:hypothetical protein
MIKEKILKRAENKLIARILEVEGKSKKLGYSFVTREARWKVEVGHRGILFYGGTYETAGDAAVAVSELREFLHEVEQKSYQLGRD